MSEPTTAVALTVEEAKALLALMDLAVKAGGLQVAEAATVLAKKIAPATSETADSQA